MSLMLQGVLTAGFVNINPALQNLSVFLGAAAATGPREASNVSNRRLFCGRLQIHGTFASGQCCAAAST